MKLGNDTKYVHVWYEGYDGLSAIINRRRVPDDPDVIFNNFLVHPIVTTKNIEQVMAPLPGSWYELEVTSGKALPCVTKEACEIIYDMVHHATVRKKTGRDIVLYNLTDEDYIRLGGIRDILYNHESSLKVEIPVCTTARYLFEEGEDGHILNGHRVQCVYRGFANSIENPGERYEIGTNPLDRDQF